MTQQRLALAPGEKPRLELDWGTYMREFEIRLDGEEIGRIEGGQRALKEAHVFTLPDGSELSIRLKQNQLVDELEVLRDGKPLPGSASSPAVKLSASVRSSFYWGLLALFAAIIIFLTDSDFVQRLSFSRYSVVFGAALLFVSVMTSRRSQIAAYLAPLLFIADWTVAFIVAQQVGLSFNFISTIAMLARFLSLVPLVQGATALRHLPSRSGVE